MVSLLRLPAAVQVGSGFKYARADAPVTDHCPLVPSGDLYGAAKTVGSVIAVGYAALLPTTLLRPVQVYGLGEASQRLEPLPIATAVEDDRLDSKGWSSGMASFRSTPACAKAAMAVSETTQEIVNAGTGQAVRGRDAAECIAASADAPADLLRVQARPRSPNDEELLLAGVPVYARGPARCRRGGPCRTVVVDTRRGYHGMIGLFPAADARKANSLARVL